jgi:primosomal protein DnaI
MDCENHIQGYCYLPQVKNNKVVFNYKACRFQEKLMETTRYLDNVSYFDVPNAIKEAKMKDIYTNDKNRFEVITYLKDFITNYGKEPLKGLYLNGSFGSGKSYLVAAMFNELAKKEVKSSVVFWPEFLRDLKASFQSDYSEKFEMIKRAPLLLIDDIGAENTTAWSRDEILCPLLQYRMDQNLPTFFTSNLTLEDLEHHFSITKDGSEEVKARRIIERIKQLTVDKKLISKNLRK